MKNSYFFNKVSKIFKQMAIYFNMLKTFIQGFLIGMAKMIPGFSGSLLAIIFGVYGKTLDIIAHLKNIDKSKLCYLLLLGSGIVLGIIISGIVLVTRLIIILIII